ncbi:MAG: HipA domain-containing protein [Coriobacteriia bacterium]|nr:HipA domain-containing protein [Coriobacteriia bacterium]
MRIVNVYRVPRNEPILVGALRMDETRRVTFSYSGEYLRSGSPKPLALSLPCKDTLFDTPAIAPYFAGLLPEGEPRERTAAALGVDKDDYVALLERLGHDCIGDIMFRSADDDLSSWKTDSYIPLDHDEFRKTVSGLADEIASNIESRLSLCGTQGKVGLALINGAWHRPVSGAASTHILKTSYLRDIPELEYCCMHAASAFGINAPETTLLDAARPVIASRRYDRVVKPGENPTVIRLHQADIAQHLGVLPSMKYGELEGGTYKSLARLLRTVSGNPAYDIDQLTRIIIANYLLGNCDNHLKNLSLIERGNTLRLAPAYDLVCTTRFERFSREMGASIGTTRAIDDVRAHDFAMLCNDLGITAKALKRICAEAVEVMPRAILDAADSTCALESTPYIAEDLVDDIQSRVEILREYTS